MNCFFLKCFYNFFTDNVIFEQSAAKTVKNKSFLGSTFQTKKPYCASLNVKSQ